jgi:hypothetical protein
MALLSHYWAAMAKTSAGDLGGFGSVFKYLNLFVQALVNTFSVICLTFRSFQASV